MTNVTKYLAGTLLIFVGATVAWILLGATVVARTDYADLSSRVKLDAQWGSAQTQIAPKITALHERPLPIDRSDVRVVLDMQQRRNGLLWYSLYDVRFAATYTVRNTSPTDVVVVRFDLPSGQGNFTDLRFAVDGKPVETVNYTGGIGAGLRIPSGRQARIDIGYSSRGAESWTYRFGDRLRHVGNFALQMRTNFAAVDFPADSLLPTTETQVPGGWLLSWEYRSIVTSSGIGLTIPVHAQPGPIAQRITFWAPVALLFYFFVMVVIVTLRRIELHPYNYFFLACAFFAFHLLFAYLVDRIPIEWAFVICSLVSLALTVSYLRLVVGLRFAAVESGIAQLVYLILFSVALCNEGWSGLSITIGVIITLFVVMQATGRMRWSKAA